MNTPWKPTEYGPRGLELQFYNSIHHNHGLSCGCDDTILHILYIINQQNSSKKLSLKELKKIKCQLTGENGDGDAEGDQLGIDAGDLELLFGEENDVTEDDNHG